VFQFSFIYTTVDKSQRQCAIVLLVMKKAILIILALNSADVVVGDDKKVYVVNQWKALFGEGPVKDWSLKMTALTGRKQQSSSSGYIIANQYQPTNVWYPHWCDFKTTSAFGIATG
jgi:hypothetical protein